MLPMSCRVIRWGDSWLLARESGVHPQSSWGVPWVTSHGLLNGHLLNVVTQQLVLL